MITERWCLLVCIADNCWNDSPTRPDCQGEIYYKKLRADVRAWNEIVDCAVKEYEGKLYVICLAELRTENPVAKRFVDNIYDYVNKGEN